MICGTHHGRSTTPAGTALQQDIPTHTAAPTPLPLQVRKRRRRATARRAAGFHSPSPTPLSRPPPSYQLAYIAALLPFLEIPYPNPAALSPRLSPEMLSMSPPPLSLSPPPSHLSPEMLSMSGSGTISCYGCVRVRRERGCGDCMRVSMRGSKGVPDKCGPGGHQAMRLCL